MFKKIFLCIIILLLVCRSCYCDCTLIETADRSEDKKFEEELLATIEPLKGKQFRTEQVINGSTYIYYVSICAKVSDEADMVGAVQRFEETSRILGQYSASDIIGGTNWVDLTYYGGTSYDKHCNHTSRITRIMIICDPDTLEGNFRIIEEKRKKKSDFCHYLFELGSSVACIKNEKSGDDDDSKLSSGSIFCILFFTFAIIYLVLGFLYQRYIIGAKGLEQIPNYGFWRAFGNLQADACDFVCRCGPRHESHAYRGIDERLKPEEERDEQLLN